MIKKAKKKTVHWTKLPRAKLVSMVKRLELANAKLTVKLTEARETRLLYTAALVEASGVALQSMVHPGSIETAEIEIKDPAEQTGFKIMANPFATTDEAARRRFVMHINNHPDSGITDDAPAKMPWE